MSPKMTVVAGPPGSGKSTAFPVAGFGVAFFNADESHCSPAILYRHINVSAHIDFTGLLEKLYIR
jgi:hypothetical protein